MEFSSHVDEELPALGRTRVDEHEEPIAVEGGLGQLVEEGAAPFAAELAHGLAAPLDPLAQIDQTIALLG